jgi:hypothetical protein
MTLFDLGLIVSRAADCKLSPVRDCWEEDVTGLCSRIPRSRRRPFTKGRQEPSQGAVASQSRASFGGW